MTERTGDEIISWPRFKRGFKSGVRQVFEANVIGIPLLGTLFATTAPQEVRDSIIHAVSNATLEQIAGGVVGGAIAEGFVATTFGTATGIIDSFRPTSRFFKRHLEMSILSDIYKGFRAVRNFEYRQKTREAIENTVRVSYAVLRPRLSRDIEENKGIFISLSTGTGAVGGGAFLGASWMYDKFDRTAEYLLGLQHLSTPDIDTILQHPVEIVAATAAVGLIASTYAVLFGRRPRSLANRADI